MRRSVSFRSVAAVGFSILAGVAVCATFVEKPGVQEFTGQMIVRPYQVQDLQKKGFSARKIATIRARAAQRLSGLAREYVPETDEYIVDVPWVSNENRFSDDLMSTGDYQYASPNWYVYPVRVPNDPQYGQQWHHPMIKAPQAWDIWTGRSTFITAFVDTGIDLTHPDLAPNRVPGYNSVDRLAEVSGGQVNDLNGHGTHVAGDGSAIGNNGIGVAGVGWNFRIMMIRTSNSAGGGAFTDDIMAGARWAAENGAKTISASYAGVDSPAVGTTGTYIKGIGGLFFYAAGNDARNLSVNYPDTIVVGASNEQDTRASFSAYGAGIGVFAPGENILSTTLGGGYGLSSGTSMATPVANGATALMWSLNPSLTPNTIQQFLYSTCDNIGSSAIFGHGRINVLRGVQRVQATLTHDVAPVGVGTYVGNHVGGTLAEILNPGFGKGFDVASIPDRVGHIAGAYVDFTSDVSRSNVTALEATIDAKTDRSQATTGMIYFWNYNTGAYVMSRAYPVSVNGSTGLKAPVPTPLSAYVSNGRNVRMMVRSLSPNRIGRPYTFRVSYAKLAVGGQP